MAKRLRSEGVWVRGVDLKHNPFSASEANEFVVCDLRDPYACRQAIDRRFDEVINLPQTWEALAMSSPASTTPT